MRGCAVVTAMALGGCGGGAVNPLPVADGEWDAYGYAAHITCGARPVLLTGNHMDLTLDGPCRMVRVAGDHNDISVGLVAGGSIDITGAHNDVDWHLLPGATVPPSLTDHGASNSFHAAT
jgi:hypothetical protein